MKTTITSEKKIHLFDMVYYWQCNKIKQGCHLDQSLFLPEKVQIILQNCTSKVIKYNNTRRYDNTDHNFN